MGLFLAWADRFEEWRALLEQLFERAVGEGDESSIPVLLRERCFAEMSLGNLAEAKHLLEEAVEASGSFHFVADSAVSTRLGLVDRARDAGERALAEAEESGKNWVRISALGALGFLELSLGHAAQAHGYLARAAAGAEAAGIREPSACEFVIDDAEALIALGQLDDAGALLEPFEERALALDRPTARGGCARCRGLLLAARGDLPGALAALEEALEQHERAPRPFELARSLLALGVIRRRAKQKAAARQTLEQALATFDRVGARLWAEKARTELGRIGGRAPSRWELTPTEEQVAALVAAGHSNREVAAQLFMSVRTVDWNLRKIYGKLGVHSRRELAAHAQRAADS
jgi:DNA-binding CsgD family transcriptional regulator